MARTNWAGNLTYGASRLIVPDTVEAAQEAVRAATTIRPLGSRHCFNTIADTTGDHLSLERLNRVVSLDRERAQVTVEGSIRYSDLGPWLHEQGFALPNLASLPHITIAGACATATHGSGMTLGNLATRVSAIEFIDAAGDLVALSRAADPDTFPGAVVNLGALGGVTRMTLDLQPAFDMHQHIHCDLPMDAVEAHFDEILGSGYSVSLFTRWQGDAIEQLWVKDIAGSASRAPAEGFFGARPATVRTHPVAGLDAVNCTEQMGVAGPAYDRLPHFRIDSIPAGGGDYQAEYFVRLEDAPAVVKAVRGWAGNLDPILMVSEVRVIAADDLWMSPCHGQPSVGFHFSFHPDWPAIREVLPRLDALLAPFAPRPHWGKLFTMEPAKVQAGYPKRAAFRDLARSHDPDGKFTNDFLDRYVFVDA